MPKGFQACMRCGSQDLRMPSIGGGDAFIPGTEDVMGTLVCERCGFKSVPIEFDSRKDAEAFRAQREKAGSKT